MLLLGRVGDKLVVYERAISAAELAGDLELRRTVTASTAYALHQGPTPAEEAIGRCEELIRRNPGDRAVEATVTRCMAALMAMTGRDEALELHREEQPCPRRVRHERRRA